MNTYFYRTHPVAASVHTEFLTQRNVSIKSADHLTKLYPKMFPDLKIEKNFRCSRTKTTCVLNKVIALKLKGYLSDFMKFLPYSLVNSGFMTTA